MTRQQISTTYYNNQLPFLVAVDCVIFGFQENALQLLTFKRYVEPQAGGLSLLGDFLHPDENLDQAAARILALHTGLDKVYLQQVSTYSDLDRDPGKRVISVAYVALIHVNSYTHLQIENADAAWVDISQKDQLIFDHPQMVADALALLRKEAAVSPVGINLLPSRFTLTQLQRLYEVIFDEETDKRNFRKKILSQGWFNKLTIKDKEGSRRGAFYYELNDRAKEAVS